MVGKGDNEARFRDVFMRSAWSGGEIAVVASDVNWSHQIHYVQRTSSIFKGHIQWALAQNKDFWA